MLEMEAFLQPDRKMEILLEEELPNHDVEAPSDPPQPGPKTEDQKPR